MNEATSTLAPAGWYDDGHGAMRWWDGYQWTAATMDPRPAAHTNLYVGSAVAQRRLYKTSHGFHLLMTIFTLGLWLPVWIIVGIVNAVRA